MANIQDKLNNIKNALFGKDVRNSIHDGIDAINKEVESTTNRQEHLETTFDQLTINAGNSNAEIVDARVGENGKSYAKLGDRLDSVDSQLEHITIKIEDRHPNDVDDTIRLQKAINNAKTPSTILISEDYIVTSLVLKDGITLKGNGGSIKLKDNVCNDDSTNYYFINAMNCNNVTIDGVKIIGNQANNISYKVADSIVISGENNRVINCTILDSVDSGIMFSGCKNSEISGNRIDNCRDLGIYINDGTGENHYENIVSNNKITNCYFGGIACKRITQRTILNNNQIFNCGNGITLENASTNSDFSKNMVITNNVLREIGFNFEEAGGIGVDIRRSHNTILSNNKIEFCKNQSIIIQGSDYCNITNNLIIGDDRGSSNYNIGILVSERLNNGSNNNVISNNVINNVNSKGVYINTNIDCKNNIFKGNIIKSNSQAFRTQIGLCESIIECNIFNSLGNVDYEDYGSRNCIINNNQYVNSKISGLIDCKNGNMFNNMGNYKQSFTLNNAPTTGSWLKNDIVYNMNLVILGTSPNRYIVYGWKRLTDGDSHEIGEDWLELKFNIDNIDYSNRLSGIGNPSGSFKPRFIGDEVIDTINKRIYKAIGLSDSDWVQIASYI